MANFKLLAEKNMSLAKAQRRKGMRRENRIRFGESVILCVTAKFETPSNKL